jgi:Leucine-rich repeat (LRR) protein
MDILSKLFSVIIEEKGKGYADKLLFNRKERMNSVPDDIMIMIQRFLTERDTLHLASSCKNHSLVLLPHLYHSPKLSNQKHISQLITALSNKGKYVTNLDCSLINNRWKFLNGNILRQIIPNCQNIQKLDLNYCLLTDLDIDLIKSLNLCSLSLSHTKITDAGVLNLISLVNLNELDISRLPNVSNLSLIPLFKNLLQLECLFICGTRASVEALGFLCDKIEFLDISCCYLMGDLSEFRQSRSKLEIEIDSLVPGDVEWIEEFQSTLE